MAKHDLAEVPSLPYLIVYGRSGQRIGTVNDLDLAALDRLIERAARP